MTSTGPAEFDRFRHPVAAVVTVGGTNDATISEAARRATQDDADALILVLVVTYQDQIGRSETARQAAVAAGERTARIVLDRSHQPGLPIVSTVIRLPELDAARVAAGRVVWVAREAAAGTVVTSASAPFGLDARALAATPQPFAVVAAPN
jgi:4'-phosphopantetheinyl transferase EntD